MAKVRVARNPKTAWTSAKPLPPAATGCSFDCMVRRGSTVRVRQRALQKPRKGLLSCFPFLIDLHDLQHTQGYGALYGAFRSTCRSLEPPPSRFVPLMPSSFRCCAPRHAGSDSADRNDGHRRRTDTSSSDRCSFTGLAPGRRCNHSTANFVRDRTPSFRIHRFS